MSTLGSAYKAFISLEDAQNTLIPAARFLKRLVSQSPMESAREIADGLDAMNKELHAASPHARLFDVTLGRLALSGTAMVASTLPTLVAAQYLKAAVYANNDAYLAPVPKLLAASAVGAIVAASPLVIPAIVSLRRENAARRMEGSEPSASL